MMAARRTPFLGEKSSPVQREPGTGSLSKRLFDKLLAVFQNLESSEKPVIANERHP
jgi:hypothetical protein